MGLDEYIDIIQSKRMREELEKNEIYRALYKKAIDLINQGHDPFAVALALTSLVTVILEGIDSYARSRQRPA